MKDVALVANVSIATVTRVINNTGYVSQQTRANVERVIEELDYVPNKMAGILKSHTSGILGNIILATNGNPFVLTVSEAIALSASSIGYHILTVLSDNELNSERDLMNDLMGRMVDGIILTGGVDSNPKDIQAIINRGIPVIMVERPLTVLGADSVLLDSFGGAAMAADHILSRGHRTIGFIGRERIGSVEIDRFEGFAQTLALHKLPLIEANCRFTDEYDPDQGYEAIKTMLKGKHRPTAVFITSDVTASGAMQYLYEQGIRVPDDISIVGYDNTFSAMTAPPITTIALPINEIGKTTIQLFAERKLEGRKTAKSVTLSPSLLDRGTVCQYKRNRT